MEKDKERLQVIQNIRQAIAKKIFNVKVETNDHIVTPEEREHIILKYDTRKKKLRNKAKTIAATSITDSLTDFINLNTEIKGIENIKDITLRLIAPNRAPIIWLLNATLCFGINIYKNKKIIKVKKIKLIFANISYTYLKSLNSSKYLCIIDSKLLPNTSKTIPVIIRAINTIVCIIDFIFIYINELLFLSSIPYTECNPLVNANNPRAADKIVNIIDIDIVPTDFEYTSLTIPNTNSFILDGII